MSLIKALVVILLVCGILFSSACEVAGPEYHVDVVCDESKQGAVLYRVVRVIDGDTLIVNIEGIEERVRLIGVDAPESVHPDEERNSALGFIATEFTKSFLEG
jgi:endonuclease YncB( thermonuclease family)